MTAGYESPPPQSDEVDLTERDVRGPFQLSSCAHQISGNGPEGADSLPPKFRDSSRDDLGPAEFPAEFSEEAALLIREACRTPDPSPSPRTDSERRRPLLVYREPPARGAHAIAVPASYALFSPPANQTEALQERRITDSRSHESPPVPERRYDCPNYESCLNIAGALNWEGFTCGRCSGAINEQLVWQAQTARRRDGVAQALCSGVPELSNTRIVKLRSAVKGE